MFVCSCARRARTAGHDNSIRRYFTGIYIQYTVQLFYVEGILKQAYNTEVFSSFQGSRDRDKFLKISQFYVNRSRSETALCKIDCLSLPKYYCTQYYI